MLEVGLIFSKQRVTRYPYWVSKPKFFSISLLNLIFPLKFIIMKKIKIIQKMGGKKKGKWSEGQGERKKKNEVKFGYKL